MLAIFCFLSVSKLTNLHADYRKDRYLSGAAESCTHSCGPRDAKWNQTAERCCPPMSLTLSYHTDPTIQALQSPTLQEPARKRGWAHQTSVCQMNLGPCNESVQRCNPPPEAFWDHTCRWRKKRWSVSQESNNPKKELLFTYFLCSVVHSSLRNYAEREH